MNSLLDIFVHFFKLGWVSFGGPAAHIGYFRKHFVEQEKWLTDEEFSQYVALSHFLPGPGSSQVGFSIGYQRHGIFGGIAAFLGFTLPSFLIMAGLVIYGLTLLEGQWLASAISGLKMLALVVVADAIYGMARNFCQETITRIIAIVVAIILLLFSGLLTQIGCLIAAAVLGQFLIKQRSSEIETEHSAVNGFKLGKTPFLIFVVLLISFPILASFSPWIELSNQFYQAGSWVFGGGHVVLPLLQEQVLAPHSLAAITEEQFLTGYAAAQGVPGPMFTLATFLGPMLTPDNPWLGATIATISVFLPGFLLLVAFLNSWKTLQANPKVQSASQGMNAAVVGLLIATLVSPVATSALTDWIAIPIVLLGGVLMKKFNWPILALIGYFVLAGIVKTFLF